MLLFLTLEELIRIDDDEPILLDNLRLHKRLIFSVDLIKLKSKMQRKNLPLIALRSFEAATRHLSIKDAAAELGVTPGAVSQQVKALELLLCVPLFSRGHRQLSLTGAGTSLAQALGRNFAEMEQVLEQISSGPMSKKIRLKLVPSLAIRWLVPRLADFYGKHSGFDVEVATGMATVNVSLDDVDFACRLGTGHWPGLHAAHLFDDAFVPVCAPTLAAKLSEPSDILGYPILHSMMRMEAWKIWFEESCSAPFKPKSEMSFANAALAYKAAEDGLGIAIAQQAYVEADLASGRLVAPFPQRVKTSLAYYLVCTNQKSQLHKNRVFLDWLEDAATP